VGLVLKVVRPSSAPIISWYLAMDSKFARFKGHFSARPRLVGCVLLSFVLYFALPTSFANSFKILIAWNISTWIYLVLAARMMAKATTASIKQRAMLTDESRFVVLTLAVVAASVSMAAIFVQLGAVKDAQGYAKGLHLAFAFVTILSAWVFIHVIFTQHYANEFFVERDSERDCPPEARDGLRFPATPEPNFMDFLYFSFVIGCASQTADVETTSSQMRAITLVHGIISFFFNTTILALTINIASGLI
jgi:uncharacterized membrane protein